MTEKNDALAETLLRRVLTDVSGWQQQREGQPQDLLHLLQQLAGLAEILFVVVENTS